MKRKFKDIRDTGCINMHKAKARSSGAPKHVGLQPVRTIKVLMCVFNAVPAEWAGPRWGKKGKSPLPVFLPSFWEGLASSCTAQPESYPPPNWAAELS